MPCPSRPFRLQAAASAALGALLVHLALLAHFALPALPAEAAGAPRPKSPLIVVGWDGGDWKLLDELIGRGLMPNLASLVSRGRTWDLESFNPMISPLVWTTVATGRSPVDHRVADFQEIDPKSRARLPISGSSRRVPAIWNAASSLGLKVGVVGWWATWPAERVNGFLVSDRAAPVLFPPEALLQSPALAWPEGLGDGVRLVGRREGSPPFEEVAKGLRVTKAEFDAAVAAKKDLADPVTGYRKILGSMRVYERTALDLYDRERPDLLMVYFQGTDEIGHVLGRFHPPKLPTVSDEEFRKYSGGVVAFYQEADRTLGEFAKRAARDGATLFVLSDHGFKWGADRPAAFSGVQFDTAFLWHELAGMMVAAGPGIVPSRARGKASVFDAAPTFCRLLGLPPDPAFEGRPVPGLRAEGLPAPRPPVSWERTVKVERLVVQAGGEADRRAGEEFTKKLISLGYLTGPEAAAVDARPADRAGAETSGAFQNIGTFLRARGKAKDSIEWYRRALEVNPKSASAWFNESVALQSLDRLDESDDALLSAVRNGYHDPEGAIYRRVASYQQRGEKAPAFRARAVSLLRGAVEASPANDRYAASLGRALFEAKDCAGSQAVFRGLLARRPRDVESLNLVALTSLCLGDVEGARGYFQRSLAVNPNQPAVRDGLSEIDKGRKLSR